jgi:hypothetical protein
MNSMRMDDEFSFSPNPSDQKGLSENLWLKKHNNIISVWKITKFLLELLIVQFLASYSISSRKKRNRPSHNIHYRAGVYIYFQRQCNACHAYLGNHTSIDKGKDTIVTFTGTHTHTIVYAKTMKWSVCCVSAWNVVEIS